MYHRDRQRARSKRGWHGHRCFFRVRCTKNINTHAQTRSSPYSIAVDAFGVLFVSEKKSGIIRRIIPDGLLCLLCKSQLYFVRQSHHAEGWHRKTAEIEQRDVLGQRRRSLRWHVQGHCKIRQDRCNACVFSCFLLKSIFIR